MRVIDYRPIYSLGHNFVAKMARKDKKISTAQNLFRQCTAELGMKGYRLVTTRKEFEKVTGVTPKELGKYSHRAAIAPDHKLVWLSELFIKDRLNEEYPDVEEVKEAIYHELLHAKHPKWGETRVDKEANRLLAKPKPKVPPLQIVYHGTNEAAAKKILKNGFKLDTYFATHLEHALGYGGNYIFEVAMPTDAIPKTPSWAFVPPSQKNEQYWEFNTDEVIPPAQIVELKRYPAAKIVTKNKSLRTEVFASKTKRQKERLQIVYHGTDEATAKKILKTGFKPGTFFAIHLEDSLGFGGNYIFEVAVRSASLPKPDKRLGTDWEFISTDRVPPSQIVEVKHYPKAKTIMENKALGEVVFQSNMPKPKKPIQDVYITPPGGRKYKLARQAPKPGRLVTRKIVKGVGYGDKSNRRLSRTRRKGFKKVRFA